MEILTVPSAPQNDAVTFETYCIQLLQSLRGHAVAVATSMGWHMPTSLIPTP